MNVRSTFFHSLSFLIACNYFAFRIELFDDEYETTHPALPYEISFTVSSLNWEAFDKDNASAAFVIHPETEILFLCFATDTPVSEIPDLQPFEIIRDKSPPSHTIDIYIPS